MKFHGLLWNLTNPTSPASPAQPSPAQPSPAQPSQPLGATRDLLGATRGSVLQCFTVFCSVFTVFCSVFTVFCSVLQCFFAVFASAAEQTAAEQPPRNPVLGSVFPAPAAACMLSAVNRTQEMLHLSPPNPPKKNPSVTKIFQVQRSASQPFYLYFGVIQSQELEKNNSKNRYLADKISRLKVTSQTLWQMVNRICLTPPNRTLILENNF